MKDLVECLQERGLVEQMTSPDLAEYMKKPRKVYVGFDPTANSLHLGNMVGIVALEWCRRFGHTPYVILGGATSRIGDPSGKSKERPFLDDATLKGNLSAIRSFFEGLFYNLTPACVVLNNDDWLSSFALIDFLRDVGKYFRISQMLAKENVKIRLQSEEGLSFTEFSYQVLQGYDFAYLSRQYEVTIQMGGSDQWGNITAGTEYNRKMGGEPLYGLTFPLLTKSDGKKFGKTEEGAIWLSSQKLSAYQFYQHLVRVADADVIKLLRMLTFIDMQEIREIECEMPRNPNIAQRRLAAEVTRYIHGEAGLEAALKVTEGVAPGATAQLTKEVLQELMRDMPHANKRRGDVVGKKMVELFVDVGLVESKSEATRLIKNGGAYLNDESIDDVQYIIRSADLIEGGYLLLGVGKKKKFLIHIEDRK